MNYAYVNRLETAASGAEISQLRDARLCNTLPSTLRQLTSYGRFRRHLKAHLFRG